MWIVQVVRGDVNRVMTSHDFATKREALSFISRIPIKFIGRQGQTYTIYPKGR